MKNFLEHFPFHLAKEKNSLWVCVQAKLFLKKYKIFPLIWPICFIKGNLTLGIEDSFASAYFKPKERKLKAEVNKKISPIKIKHIFYRVSNLHEYGPTSLEK